MLSKYCYNNIDNSMFLFIILIIMMEKTSPQLTADGQISLRSICPTGHPGWGVPRPVCVSGDVFFCCRQQQGEGEAGVAPCGVPSKTNFIGFKMQGILWLRNEIWLSEALVVAACSILIKRNTLVGWIF